MHRSLAAIAALTALLATPLSSLAADTLPQRAVPGGLRAADGNHGGRIIDGPLAGVHSPADAFRSALTKVGPYFDRPPRIESAVRSNDGSLTVGLFRTTFATQPVAGLAFVAFGQRGGSRVAVIFDRTAHFRTSLKPLLTRLYASAPAAPEAQRSSDVVLQPRVSPDGSVRIAVPAGWKTPIFAQGVVVVTGPNGEEIDKQLAINFLDPRGSNYQSAMALARSSRITPQLTGIPLPYVSDAAAAYVTTMNLLASKTGQPKPNVKIESSTPQHDPYVTNGSVDAIAGTLTVHGVRNRFAGSVLSAAPNQFGAWMVAANIVSAPESAFEHEFPVLKAISESYRIDQSVRSGQVHATIVANQEGIARNGAIAQATQARNAAVFHASMSHARAVQDGIDRSTAGFTRYLSDTDVIENTATGAHATVDYDFADSIVKSDPQNFRTVPVSEYQRGVDF